MRATEASMKKAIITLSLLVVGVAGIVSLAGPSAEVRGSAPAVNSTPAVPPTPAQGPTHVEPSPGEKAPSVALTALAPVSQDSPQGAPDKLPPGKACVECHAEVIDEKHVHRPVRVGDCKLCHLQQDRERHDFDRPKDMGKVCKECHTLPERNSLHAPVRDGECLSCHLAHQSDKRYLLRFVKEVEQCGQCHADQVGIKKRFVHGPVAAGVCSLCHLPHSSNEPKLLRSKDETSCLVCHVDMVERLEPPNSVHPPVKENCAQCHDPHASDHRYQLKSEPKALCMDCHQPMMEELEAQPYYHEALNSEEGCSYCHDVHSSPYPKMLRQPVRELCMSCHDGPIKRPDGTELAGMGEKLRSSAHLHGPLAEGNCAACHDPHGSVTFSLLRDPYPKTFYTPWDPKEYALCFRCHDVGAFLTSKTEILTGFRNGDANLHFVHVNDEKKGRTCRACHDKHASNRPKLVTEGVPFGSWEIPINFAITPTGGSCSPGCHTERKYDRFEPVPNLEDTALLLSSPVEPGQ